MKKLLAVLFVLLLVGCTGQSVKPTESVAQAVEVENRITIYTNPTENITVKYGECISVTRTNLSEIYSITLDVSNHSPIDWIFSVEAVDFVVNAAINMTLEKYGRWPSHLPYFSEGVFILRDGVLVFVTFGKKPAAQDEGYSPSDTDDG